MSPVLPFPPAAAPLASVFGDGLGTREGQIYFTWMAMMLVPNLVAYFLFYGVAALRNRDPQKTRWNKKLAGTVGVLAFSAVACWGFWVRAVDHAYVGGVDSRRSIEHITTVLALPVLPALLLLLVVGAWWALTFRPE
jgi:hypothetical protein